MCVCPQVSGGLARRYVGTPGSPGSGLRLKTLIESESGVPIVLRRLFLRGVLRGRPEEQIFDFRSQRGGVYKRPAA